MLVSGMQHQGILSNSLTQLTGQTWCYIFANLQQSSKAKKMGCGNGRKNCN
jgi:hypothetical protein